MKTRTLEELAETLNVNRI